MELNDFLKQELKNLTVRELKNAGRVKGELYETALRLFDNFFGESKIPDEELGALMNYVEESGFEFSEGYRFIFDELVKDDNLNFHNADLARIEHGIKYDPKNRIYPLYWVFNQQSLFDSEEYLDSDYAKFLDKIIEDYGYLIELDDFLFSTNILLIKPTYEDWEKEIFLPVFKKAADKYPAKHAFTRILAHIYYKDGDYDSALQVLEAILNSVEKELQEKDDNTIGNSDFPYIDYLEVVQLTGMTHYSLGAHDKAMKFINYVIDNLPVVSYEDGEEPEILSFVDSFFFRMLYNVKKNNHEEVIGDFNRIKGVLFLSEWEKEYPSLFEYLSDKKLV